MGAVFIIFIKSVSVVKGLQRRGVVEFDTDKGKSRIGVYRNECNL